MFWRSSNFWADIFSGFFILCFSSFLTVSCKKRSWQEKRHSEQLLSNHCSLQCRTVVAKFFTSGTNCIFLAFSRRYTVDGSPLHDASRGSLVLHSILSSPDPVTMTCTQLPVAFWAQHAHLPSLLLQYSLSWRLWTLHITKTLAFSTVPLFTMDGYRLLTNVGRISFCQSESIKHHPLWAIHGV